MTPAEAGRALALSRNPQLSPEQIDGLARILATVEVDQLADTG